MAFFYISAAHKSSGKTTLSVGIAAALAQEGLRVQTFKKGPDYIDPLWLEKASGQPCYNLDFNTMSLDEIDAKFDDHHNRAEISLIEGNKGLYDGVDLDGADSNAAMAKQLSAPIILVLDCTGITRGIAPLLLGYQQFDPSAQIAGVILNKVANQRHDDKLRAVIKRFVDIPILGSVKRDHSLFASERHLGLIPPEETGFSAERLNALADLVRESIDLEALKEIAQQGRWTKEIAKEKAHVAAKVQQGGDTRIGVIRDSAFGFYYADDLAKFEELGAELIFINALSDQTLPELDGLFIGGGFPETHLEALEKNSGLRQDILTAGKAGLPIYAECGGLMYLAQSIRWQGHKAQMVGLIAGEVVMHKKPQGRGLVRLREKSDSLWKCGATSLSCCDPERGSAEADTEATFRGHEFHYASLEGLPKDSRYAFEVERGHGITGKQDGIIIHNTQANFSHLRHNKQKPWVQEFLTFVTAVKAERTKEGQ